MTDFELRRALLQKLRSARPDIVSLVDCTEFMFDDLQRIDDKSLQLVLRLVERPTWLKAWKLTPLRLQQRIQHNMSKSHLDDFMEEVRRLPRLRKSEVYAAQREIAQQTLKLLVKGRLHLKSRARLAG